MIIFNAGFILGSRANNLKVILAGGTQMAAVLLVVNSILRSMDGKIDSSNLALCTTKWINKDENSNIKALLEQLDFPINAYASDFDFQNLHILHLNFMTKVKQKKELVVVVLYVMVQLMV
jgi:NaMN:DMB phosphoribosyltransferase